MHPLRERACDDLLEHPLLRTPPPEPERPRPPRVRKPREFKLPPKFPLMSEEFYAKWCNHQKEIGGRNKCRLIDTIHYRTLSRYENQSFVLHKYWLRLRFEPKDCTYGSQLQMTKHKVDDSSPELFPELYLKPRRLDYYARQLEENMIVNKELIKKINLIQRTGNSTQGFVDCWLRPKPTDKYNKLLCKQRQRVLNTIQQQNLYIYSRLLVARSEQLLTKELDEAWKDTKHKLILGASQKKIDRGIRDPAFDKPPHLHRTKVAMEIWVRGGSKMGKVVIELFTDLVPKTCHLFLNLVKGDSRGHAYKGTRFFRIVPNLYCQGGDVIKDNGFGSYLPDGHVEPMGAENYQLKHTVPGVLSMVVTKDNEVTGQFNIIFKPLPQFDKRHVVFGRIISGPAQTLERISALGLPLGTTSSDCIIRSCGWFTRGGQFREGNTNAIKFPPRRKIK